MPLPVTIRALEENPYSHALSDSEYRRLLEDVFVARAEHIEQWYENDQATRNSFALCLLSPTAPVWVPGWRSILAVATIGPDGKEFLPNAIGKVCLLKDHQLPLGALLVSQTHRLGHNEFRWDGAACVDGTYVGGSGLAVPQDRYQSIRTAASFNFRVQSAIAAWEEAHPRTGKPRWSWFNKENKPPECLDIDYLEGEFFGASSEWEAQPNA